MADELDDELFDDVDDDSESDAADKKPKDDEPPAEPPVPEEPPEMGDLDESELLKNLVGEMSELGIVIPDSVRNCRDFCEHLHTSVQTHKATKAMTGAGGAPAEATATSEPPVEEPPMMMSTIETENALLRLLCQGKAKAIFKKRQKQLEELEAAKLPPARLSTLRQRARSVNVKPDKDGKLIRDPIDDELDLACDAVRAAKASVPAPATAPAKTAEDRRREAARLSLVKPAGKPRVEKNPVAAATEPDAAIVESLVTRGPGHSRNGAKTA